jgi:uncharacterized protein YkwD
MLRTLRVPGATIVAAFAVALFTASPASAAFACANADIVPNAHNAARLDAATECLINRERSTRHLKVLRRQPKLAHAARRYARRMVGDRFYSHIAPGGGTFVQRIAATGYLKPVRRWWLGENLMWGTDDLASPRAIVAAWMRSPSHRRNVLNPRFREFGVGSVFGAPQRMEAGTSAETYATEYGYRALR